MIYGWPKYEFHRIKNFAFKAESSIYIEIFEHESSSAFQLGIFGQVGWAEFSMCQKDYLVDTFWHLIVRFYWLKAPIRKGDIIF